MDNTLHTERYRNKISIKLIRQPKPFDLPLKWTISIERSFPTENQNNKFKSTNRSNRQRFELNIFCLLKIEIFVSAAGRWLTWLNTENMVFPKHTYARTAIICIWNIIPTVKIDKVGGSLALYWTCALLVCKMYAPSVAFFFPLDSFLRMCSAAVVVVSFRCHESIYQFLFHFCFRRFAGNRFCKLLKRISLNISIKRLAEIIFIFIFFLSIYFFISFFLYVAAEIFAQKNSFRFYTVPIDFPSSTNICISLMCLSVLCRVLTFAVVRRFFCLAIRIVYGQKHFKAINVLRFTFSLPLYRSFRCFCRNKTLYSRCTTWGLHGNWYTYMYDFDFSFGLLLHDSREIFIIQICTLDRYWLLFQKRSFLLYLLDLQLPHARLLRTRNKTEWIFFRSNRKFFYYCFFLYGSNSSRTAVKSTGKHYYAIQ